VRLIFNVKIKHPEVLGDYSME